MFGNSTAGGAYVPGMSDYVVMIKERSKVFLGGPPLVKMATGEESDDESLGGAEMHATDQRPGRLLRDRRARRHPARPPDRAPAQPAQARTRPTRTRASHRGYDPEQLLGIPSADPKVPFDPRDVIARLVDDSDFDEFKPLYGTSLVTGWARAARLPDRHPRQPSRRAVQRGSAEGGAVHPARQPGRHAAAVPAEHHRLHGRQGVRAARHHQGRREDDQRGLQQPRARTSPSTWRASYGAGNYGMCGRAYGPRFLFAWPNAKTAVMGPQQLAGVMSIVAEQSAARMGRPFDEEADAALRRQVEEQIERRVTGAVHDRTGVRRRDHRPTRHPDGARHVPRRHRQRADRGHARLRRVPDVMR